MGNKEKKRHSEVKSGKKTPHHSLDMDIFYFPIILKLLRGSKIFIIIVCASFILNIFKTFRQYNFNLYKQYKKKQRRIKMSENYYSIHRINLELKSKYKKIKGEGVRTIPPLEKLKKKLICGVASNFIHR